jgi:hypothetical protein
VEQNASRVICTLVLKVWPVPLPCIDTERLEEYKMFCTRYRSSPNLAFVGIVIGAALQFPWMGISVISPDHLIERRKLF